MLKNINSKIYEYLQKAKRLVFPILNFSLSNSSKLMSEDEAKKILNFNNNDISDLSAKEVIARADKYIKMNDPYKGGSFYLQNKIFHAKNTLLPKTKDFQLMLLQLDKFNKI